MRHDPARPDRPSWASAPAPTARRRPERSPAPTTLRLAAAVTTVLASAQAVHVARRDELVVGLRTFLVAVVLSQVLLAFGALRRSAGAALGLVVCQLTTVLASLTGGFGEQRLAFAGAAVAVGALVAVSLGAFPSVPPPPIELER